MNTTSKIMSFSLYAFTILIFTTISLAQESCEAIVQTAIETVADNCDSLRRNQACYGNVTIDAEAASDIDDFTFSARGDLANVQDIASMRLSSQIEETGEWGIGLIHLLANLPEDNPAPITIVLFGNVDIQNEVVDEPVRLPVTALAGVNVRRTPVDGTVIGSLTNGQETTAFGRNSDGSWVLIELPEYNDTGWVAGDFVRGDDLTLPVLGVGETPFGPMQAFSFVSGQDTDACSDLPASGVIIQTPDGAGRIRFSVNEVEIELGSTAYLRTYDEILAIAIIEGQGFVESENVRQYVPAGTYVEVSLDTENRANSAPAFPRAYDLEEMSRLPLALLTETVEPAPPLTPELIEAEIEEEAQAETLPVVASDPNNPLVGRRIQNTINDAIVFENGPATAWVGNVNFGDTGTILDSMPYGVTQYVLVQWDNGLLGWVGLPFLQFIDG